MKKILIILGIMAMFFTPCVKETMGHEYVMNEFTTRLYDFDQKFSNMNAFTKYLESENGLNFSNYIASLYRKNTNIYEFYIDIDVLNKFSSPLNDTYIYDFDLYEFKKTVFCVYESSHKDSVPSSTPEPTILNEKKQSSCNIL